MSGSANPHAAQPVSWLDEPGHREWLRRGFAGVIRFALGSIRAEGGFHHLDATGVPLPGRRPQLFLTARMAHTSALGVRHGVPGSGELLDHAMASLLGLHADDAQGGWLTEPGSVTRKSAYDHVHVGLAAATALEVGHPSAETLFDQVTSVVDARFWDPSARMLRESFAADWSDPEEYGGANANMHGVEAFLAMGRASGEPEWHRRALAVAERLVDGFAREHGWLLPEHYTAAWEPVLGYHRDEPLHPFRPYGATPGHSLEWARFLLELDASPLVESPGWLVEAAGALARRALDGGWALDRRPGLVYTVDWSGEVVAGIRLHWPVCEGIQAAAALRRRTGDPHWEGWYRRLWDHAARWWVDDRGTWRNELDDAMQEGGTVWPGRPDVYHCGGALLGPLEPSDGAPPA
ncbi:MAG: AGE family epimerase/isomerase [Phycicoccus sp.]